MDKNKREMKKRVARLASKDAHTHMLLIDYRWLETLVGREIPSESCLVERHALLRCLGVGRVYRPRYSGGKDIGLSNG